MKPLTSSTGIHQIRRRTNPTGIIYTIRCITHARNRIAWWCKVCITCVSE